MSTQVANRWSGVLRPLARFLAVALAVALPPSAVAEVVSFPALDGVGADRMVIYSSLDAPLARPLIEAFQARHPSVALRYEDLLAGEIALRVMAETDRGTTADLVFSSAMDLTVKLANDGYARAVDVNGAARWPAWANWRNMAFALTFEPAVIVWHKPSFAEGPPDSRAALIRWLATAPKGRIATYDIARSAVGYLFLSRDLEEFSDAWALVKAMGQAGVQVFPTSQEVIDAVARGDAALGYNVLGSYAASEILRQPDLGLILPRDYVVVASRVALVPAAAGRPDLGEAFLDFLMGREGQTILADRLRLAAVSLEIAGKDSAAAMQEALGARLRPVPVSPGLLAYLDPANRARVLARWQAALESHE